MAVEGPIQAIQTTALDNKMNDLDRQLDAILASGDLSQIQQVLYTTQTLISLGHKQIEKTLANLCEEERKVELKKYIGAFNTWSVIVLTGLVIGFSAFQALTLLAPEFVGGIANGDKLLKGAKPLDLPPPAPSIDVSSTLAPPAPSITVTPVTDTVADAMKKAAEKAAEKGKDLARSAEGMSNVSQAAKGLAQSYEEQEKSIHQLQEQALKFDKQQSLDPAAQEASRNVQQSLQNNEEAMRKNHDTLVSMVRG